MRNKNIAKQTVTIQIIKIIGYAIKKDNPEGSQMESTVCMKWPEICS